MGEWEAREWIIFGTIALTTIIGGGLVFKQVFGWVGLLKSAIAAAIVVTGSIITGVISTREFCEAAPEFCSQRHVAAIAASQQSPPQVIREVRERVIERVVPAEPQHTANQRAASGPKTTVAGYREKIVSADSKPFETAVLRIPNPIAVPKAERQPRQRSEPKPQQERRAKPKPKAPPIDPVAQGMIQELKRLNCLDRAHGASWGEDAVEALNRFNIYAYHGLSTTPKAKSLTILKAQKRPVCP